MVQPESGGTETNLTILYKITTTHEWATAVSQGQFKGSALDLKDGFIHLSTGEQVRETARLHFAGQENLLLVAISEGVVGAHLKWEASRGGKLFPHVYAALDPAQILWCKALPWNGETFTFPPEILP
jgi:uncharacterized protein (DUF952 family)